jgi:xanthine dehydrogenase accessory factor
MSELKQIVDLWRTAKSRQEEVCLATVVRVEGSSYRKPGARMLLTRGGQRAGTISGGCLEGEVAQKAWWLTENGPTIQCYSSFFDDESPIPMDSAVGAQSTCCWSALPRHMLCSMRWSRTLKIAAHF